MNTSITFNTNKKRILSALATVLVLSLFLALFHQNLELSESSLNTGGICIFMIGLGIVANIECRGRGAILWNGLLLLLCAAFSYTLFQVFQDTPFALDGPRFFINIGICLSIYVFIYVLTGWFRGALIVGGILTFIFGLVGHYIKIFRGDSLLYTDLFSAKTAMQVMPGYRFELSSTIWVALLVLTALIIWGCKAHTKVGDKYKSRKLRLASFTLYVMAIGLFFEADSEKFYYSWEEQSNGYPYQFMVSAKMANIKPPENYDSMMLGSLVPSLETPPKLPTRGKVDEESGEVVEESVKPNVIAIMNESFSDPKVIGDFETNVDYMPFIRSLKDDTIKGNLYLSVFGGGTCDSEYSFLTGNTTAYLPDNARPYQLYIKEKAPGLVSTLNHEGYESTAMHPNVATAWSRNRVYPLFGFKEFLSGPAFVDVKKTRKNLVSDEATYDKIINLYENKGEAPLFVFDVTIQNHSGYEADASDLEPVYLEGMEGEYPQTEQYLSLIKNSDAAFEGLVQYFNNQSEPTIILMFGDHQANVEQGFYEELKGKPLEEWTPEEMLSRYVTPFVVWANYDIEEASIEKLSVNYLSSLLLKEAGIQGTTYDRYLLDLAKTLPVITAKGVMDSNGQYFDKNNFTEYHDQLLQYKQLIHNNMIDNENRRDDLFYKK